MARLHGPQSDYPGFGLGLSLVSAIVQSHGGRVWLDPEHAPGSCFRFALPVRP